MSSTLESPSLIAPSGDDASGFVRPLTIVLAGNPNAGKTTLFNALTGLRQKVANYPGVTVERKEGAWTLAPGLPPARLIDLPGLYSLDAASIDEQIARDVITGRIPDLPKPDVIVAVVDATNLERNLYLVTQLLEYGRPLVIALTMVDLAEKRKLKIDEKKLAEALGAGVVPVVVTQRIGFDALAEAVMSASKMVGAGAGWRLSEMAERELALLNGNNGKSIDRHTALRDLYAEELPEEESRRDAAQRARERLSKSNPKWWQEPLLARYDWIEQVAAKSVQSKATPGLTATERIDRILTHKFFGPLILILVMLLVFQTIFSWASLPMDLIDKGFGKLGEAVGNLMQPGLLRDLLVDGIIAGVGGVLVFLPQILLLFFFIAILEDTGYMARAAFLMDRLMSKVGLHGKSFIPMLSSFACAIPGIMATRTIESPKDRLVTILVSPLMSCSARLPVYTLLIGACIPNITVLGVLKLTGLTMLAMYLLGIIVALLMAWLFKKTLLRGETPLLLMELPPYKRPLLRVVVRHMWDRSRLFLRRAGTVILSINILLWFLATYPRSSGVDGEFAAKRAAIIQTSESTAPGSGNAPSQTEKLAALDNEQASAKLRNSLAGHLGRFIEPVIAPLGFDWKMGIGIVSSFAAREVFVSTMSLVYGVGKYDRSQSSLSKLQDTLGQQKRTNGTPVYTPLTAITLMVFYVFALQCVSTVAVVRRETNSWKWPLFQWFYMGVLAWGLAFITYQGGRLLGWT